MLKKLRALWGAADTAVPENLFPIESESFYRNPYPFYERLRKEPPFYRSADGMWVLSRYEDNVEALRHKELGNSPSRFSTLHQSKRDRFVCADVANNIMPFLDGPSHEHHRKIIGKAFRESVKPIASQLDEIADKYVGALSSKFEVMSDLATPFAMELICRILGIPVDEKLKKWSENFFYLFTQIPSVELRSKLDENLAEFREWLLEVMRGNCQGLAKILISAVDRKDLDEAVAVDSMILFFADGLENVDSGIGNLLYAFASNPEEWSKLRADVSLLPGAVAECLRFESPAQYIARTCLSDFVWKGREFKKDSNVILMLGSANRDVTVFDEPERFNISRKPNRHLSFGLGRHACLGGSLVEQEFAAILAALRKRFREIRQVSAITWQKRKGHRWMEAGLFQGE